MVVPSVSVVIPAYRAENTIARAIDSVLAQTAPASEIIVVDDGSPDNLAAIVQQYGPPVILLRQSNRKTAITRNTGIQYATGEFVAFLDADDYWEPGKLERQLEVFAEHPEVGLVGGTYFVQEHGCEHAAVGCNHRAWSDRVLHERGERAFCLASMMWTSTLIVRRKVLGEERFVSGLEPAEDRDMWIRFVLRGPVYLISEPLATAVLEPSSISRSDVDRDCSKMLEVVGRHKGTLGLCGTMKWRSHTIYRWAAKSPARWRSFALLLQSYLYWPFPYLGPHAMQPMGRLKVLSRLMFPSRSRIAIRNVS